MSSGGQIVGGVVGAIAGFFVGGPVGAAYGAGLGAGVGGYIDPPKMPNLQGPGLQDKTFQSSAYGVSIPTLSGTIATMGSIIYLENNEYLAISKRQSQGGKGGGGGSYETTTYFATFAVLLSEARPGSKIRRWWAGGKLMYSAASNDLGTTIQSEIEYGIYDKITGNDDLVNPGWVYYDGSQTEPDPRMEAALGVGMCPSYEGTAYIMLYDFELTNFGNGLAGCPIKVEIVDAPPDEDWRVIYESSSVMPDNLPAAIDRPIFYEYPVCLYPERGTSYTSFSHAISPGDLTDRERTLTRFPDGRTEIKINSLDNRVLSWANAITESSDSYYHYDFFEGDPLIRKVGVLVGGSVALENGFKGYPLATSQPYAIVNKVFDGHGISKTFLMRANGSEWSEGYTKPAGSWFLAGSGSSLIIHDFNFTADEIGIIAVGIEMVARVIWVSGSDYHVYMYHIGNNIAFNDFAISIPGVTGSFDFTTSALFSLGKLYVLATRTDDLEAGIIRLLIIDYENDSCVVYEAEIDPILTAQPATFFNVLNDTTISVSVNPEYFTVQVFVLSTAGLSENTPFLVRDKCEQEFDRASVYSENRDFSQLDNSVALMGYKVSEAMSARAALAQLQARYLFDFVEAGYKIKAVMREKSIVDYIDVDPKKFCIFSDGSAIKSTKESAYQLPTSYFLTYLDMAREYDQNTQPARYPANHENNRNESLSIVMTPDEAATSAAKFINLSWIESKKYELKLPQEYLGLSVSQHIRFPIREGRLDFLRIDNADVGYDQTTNLQCTYATPEVYDLVSLGDSGDIVPVTNIPSVFSTSSVLLDVPMIIDSQDAPGFVAAPYGGGAGWRGAVLMRSDDGGQRYSGDYRFFGSGTVGQAINTIAYNDGFVMDRESELIVWPVSGIAFEAITESSMMTGKNYIAYGAPGRWEICCYAESDLNAEGYYVLSAMIRGMRGTEWTTGLHESGDYVVLLDDPENVFVGADLSAIGVSKKYKTVSIGQNVADVDAVDFTYSATNLRPLAPVNPEIEKSGDDWLVSASERSRYASSFWHSGLQPRRDEQLYSMKIYNADGIAVRTINNIEPNFVYTSAQQTDDFGYPQLTLTADIYQNSSTAGAGFPLRINA